MSFGFGGGDLTRRAEILLKIGVEGSNELDKARLQQDALLQTMRINKELLDQNRISYVQFLSAIKPLESSYTAIEKRIKDVTAAQNAHVTATERATEKLRQEAESEAEAIERSVQRQMTAREKREAKLRAEAEAEAAALARAVQARDEAVQKEITATDRKETKLRQEAEAEAALIEKVSREYFEAADSREAKLRQEADAEARMLERRAAEYREFFDKINQQNVGRNVSAANWQLNNLGIISTQDVQNDIIALRQLKFAMSGVRDERAYLNQVIAAGAEMERTQARAVTPDLIAKNERLQQTISETTRFIERGNRAKDEGTPKANKFGYAILNLSHAFQDLQYGTGAVLNNIPLIVTSMGGGAGLAGTLMAAAVAAQVASEQFGDLRVAIGLLRDPMTDLAVTTEGIKGKLEILSAKHWKFEADYRDIDDLNARLERIQKLKSALEGISTSTAEDDYKKEITRIAKETGATGPALQKAIAEGAAAQGMTFGAPADVEYVRNAPALRESIARRFTGPAAWLGMALSADVQSRADEAQRRIDRDTAAYAEKEAGLFATGDEGAVARMRNRVQAAPGRFTEAFRAQLGQLPGTAKQFANEKWLEEGAKELQQIEKQVEADDKRAATERERQAKAIGAFEERIEKIVLAEARKRGRESDADARERQQEINRQASLFGQQFAQEGDLTDAMMRRAQAGKDVTQGLSAQVQRTIGDAIPRDIADDVAEKIVADAKAKLDAEIAAGGGGKAGLAAAVAERREKLDRMAGLADRREAQGQLDMQEQMIAGFIAQNFGNQLGDNGVVAAARRAMNEIRQGSNEQIAIMSAIQQTMVELANEQARVRQMMFGMMNGVGAVRAQVGRNRAQRPALAPVFPGN